MAGSASGLSGSEQPSRGMKASSSWRASFAPTFEGRFPDVHSIRDWADDQEDGWLADAMRDEMLSVDSGAWLAAYDVPDPSEWESLTISADTGDDWSIEIVGPDGSLWTVDLGNDFVVAWDIYYWAEAEYDVDVETEIEY